MRRARSSSSSPSRALAAQAAQPGSSPLSGVLPSRVCCVGKVSAAPPAAVARFARLAGRGHDPREDGGHGQGVSCTDDKQAMKKNLPSRTGRCPCRLFNPSALLRRRMDIAAKSCLGDGQRGVNHANEKNTNIKTEKNSPAVPAAAVSGCFAAAALPW